MREQLVAAAELLADPELVEGERLLVRSRGEIIERAERGEQRGLGVGRHRRADSRGHLVERGGRRVRGRQLVVGQRRQLAVAIGLVDPERRGHRRGPHAPRHAVERWQDRELGRGADQLGDRVRAGLGHGLGDRVIGDLHRRRGLERAAVELPGAGLVPEIVAEQAAERVLDVGIHGRVDLEGRQHRSRGGRLDREGLERGEATPTVAVAVVGDLDLADLLLEDHVILGERDVVDLHRDVDRQRGVRLVGDVGCRRSERDQPIEDRAQRLGRVVALVEVRIRVGLEAAVLREVLGRHRRGHQQDRDAGERALLAALEHLEAGLVRLLHADDQQRRRVGLAERDALVGVELDDDVEPVAPEARDEVLVEPGIGVDQQDTSVHAPRRG